MVDDKFSSYTRNFMSVLAANGRIRDINKVPIIDRKYIRTFVFLAICVL